jgi:small subunit ribosomal protein S4
MSRYLGSSCKLCRRERTKLFLKGNKCYSNCIFEKKKGKSIPGQHSIKFNKKMSDYAIHLREKQKAKRMYGLTEEQFKHYYKIADKMKGSTGDNLLKILELRLDNVVFCLGFAFSKKMARQTVNHRNIFVNGKKVNVPRYQVKIGDIITVSDKYKNNNVIKNLINNKQKKIPMWLKFDKDKISGEIINEPILNEISGIINSQFIVEYYSK